MTDVEAEVQRRLEERDAQRMQYEPRDMHVVVCRGCRLELREHINNRFCPEWRLRQLDGDR